MFGIDLGAFIVIVIVAIIFLGPDKFPEALVQIVKFWRTLKSGVQDAKDTLQKEVDISELKTSVQEYKNSAEEYVKEMSSKVDLYGAVDSGTQDVKQEIELIKDSIESKPVEQK
jgi:sec-independent protein translocase protein TatB